MFNRLARTCSAYPRLCFSRPKAWMAGTRPAKTKLGAQCSSLRRCEIFPGQPCGTRAVGDALFGCIPYRRRRAAGARREIEQAGGQLIEVGKDFGRWDDVGVFSVHVAQADGMAGLAAVEAAFFGHDHAVIEAECVDHGGPYTA